MRVFLPARRQRHALEHDPSTYPVHVWGDSVSRVARAAARSVSLVVAEGDGGWSGVVVAVAGWHREGVVSEMHTSVHN